MLGLLVAAREPQQILPVGRTREIGLPEKAGVFDQGLPGVNQPRRAGDIFPRRDRERFVLDLNRFGIACIGVRKLKHFDLRRITNQFGRFRAPTVPNTVCLV